MIVSVKHIKCYLLNKWSREQRSGPSGSVQPDRQPVLWERTHYCAREGEFLFRRYGTKLSHLHHCHRGQQHNCMSTLFGCSRGLGSCPRMWKWAWFYPLQNKQTNNNITKCPKSTRAPQYWCNGLELKKVLGHVLRSVRSNIWQFYYPTPLFKVGFEQLSKWATQNICMNGKAHCLAFSFFLLFTAYISGIFK